MEAYLTCDADTCSFISKEIPTVLLNFDLEIKIWPLFLSLFLSYNHNHNYMAI